MNTVRVDSISKMHMLLGLAPPKHPHISLFDWKDVQPYDASKGTAYDKAIFDFYIISIKDAPCAELRYGRNTYDFSEGSMMFVGPGQVMGSTGGSSSSGWALIFHPELIRHSKLASKMSEYTFFQYNLHEALHLSDKEKSIISSLVEQIKEEYSSNIDIYTKEVIVSQLELLFNYSQRFYTRQFITRTAHHSDLVSNFEAYLIDWFESGKASDLGLPTVKQCAEKIGMSPDYLSDMLKQETGKSAQEHIHFMLIEKAKNELLSTSHSVNEIAYELGFEYPQYFSKLFKSKTGMTPSQYRRS